MRSRTQKSLLMSFVLSIAGCGVVGIYCLMVGRFGSLVARILGTALVVAASSILALAGAIPWERRHWQPVGSLSVLATVVAMVMALIAIWDEPHYKHWFWKAMGTACVIGVALPHVGLLSLARLRRQYGWVRRVTIILITLLAAGITYIIIEPPAYYDEEIWMRVIGILSIGVACGTIAVPILHRMSSIRTGEEVRTTALILTLTCPRCETSQQLPAGRSRCAQCGLKFQIQIEEELCKACGYSLYKLTSANCPECGALVTQATTD